MSAHVRRSSLLLSACLGGSLAAQTINVDASADRKPIDPRVYGLAFASTVQLADLNVPLNRLGGNTTTRYNWQLEADNRGADWYFESIAYGATTPGMSRDDFVTEARAVFAEPALTLPMIGWLAKVGPNRAKLASFNSTLYGAQTDCDWSWFAQACNGILTSGADVTGNNPADASVLQDAAFQRGFVQHEVTRWGLSYRGGVRYYILDNEHSIWHATHRDVHPTGASMDEIYGKIADYSARIREGDPLAVILGPEEWGWTGYLYSGYDSWWASTHGWQNPLPDRVAHQNMDYMPWLLQRLKQNDTATGGKSLDVFTLHYYPQGGEFWGDASPVMQQRRNRSTRSLWDPSYTDETWINDKVRLIPRMKQWVSQYYPGLQTGITEYNWGAEDHINGATTQADILGIFGREGLDLAARWTTPDTATPTYKAIKLYRNYDGNRSGFGDVSVRATAPGPDTLSAFAAVRTTDGALTVMVVAKAESGTANVTVNLAGFTPAGSADVWQLGTGNVISHLAALSVGPTSFTASVPAPSVTLFVLPSAAPLRPRGDFNGDGQADLLWRNPSTGQVRIGTMRGAVQTSSVLVGTTEPDANWQVVGTHDFSGDGKTDILWRHAQTGALRLWSMNGPAVLGTTALSPATLPDLNWRVGGTGDFNGDGKPDIMWRHALSGNNVVWLMNGVTRIAGTFTNPANVGELNWEIAGTADFNSDGKSDLLWRNLTSGNMVVWLMNGTERITGMFTTPASQGDPNWHMAAVGDFSRDGLPDVVWHHLTGRTLLWEMKGLSRSYGVFTTPDVIQDTSWLLVGPR